MNLEINIIDPDSLIGEKSDIFFVVFKTALHNFMVDAKHFSDEVKGEILTISMGDKRIREFNKLFNDE